MFRTTVQKDIDRSDCWRIGELGAAASWVNKVGRAEEQTAANIQQRRLGLRVLQNPNVNFALNFPPKWENFQLEILYLCKNISDKKKMFRQTKN